MLEKLSGDYIRGYTKAIQDMQEVFTYIQPDLKHHHKNINNKSVCLYCPVAWKTARSCGNVGKAL